MNLTDLDLPKITYLENSGENINKIKILLANETTKMLHGDKAAKDSEKTAEKTFGEKSISRQYHPMFRRCTSNFKRWYC